MVSRSGSIVVNTISEYPYIAVDMKLLPNLSRDLGILSNQNLILEKLIKYGYDVRCEWAEKNEPIL